MYNYGIKGLIVGDDNLYFWVRTPSKKPCLFKTKQEAQNYIDMVLKPDNEKVFYFIKNISN